MKRLGNLYKNTYNFNNITSAFNEVCRNTLVFLHTSFY